MKSIGKKFYLFFILYLSFSLCYGQDNDLPQANLPQNPIALTFQNNASLKDFTLAIGETLFTNITVDTVFVFADKQNWTPVTFKTFPQAVTSPWIWDSSPFTRNEGYHPYFGALYFVSGRSNNLNFFESFILAAAGSWMWETLYEGGGNSINDLLTTTTAGAAMGEMHHRLFYSFKDIAYPLAIIASPVDAITSFVRGNYYPPKGDIYSIELYAGGGIFFNSPRNFLNPAISTRATITYENPYGHNSQELMDQFTFNLEALYSNVDAYFVSADFNGTLYAFEPFTLSTGETTLGTTYNYQMIYSPISLFSSGNIGITWRQKFYTKSNITFSYQTNIDFTFLGTTDIYYLYEKIGTETFDPNQQTYSYNYGPGLYLFAGLENEKLGSINLEGRAYFYYCYEAALKDAKANADSIILQANVDYTHKIVGNLSIGINVAIYNKFSFFTQLDNIKQLQHKSQLYLKWNF